MVGEIQTRAITREYNANGFLTSVTDPRSTYGYLDENFDRVTSVDNMGTPGVPDTIVAVEYDAAGNRTSMTANVDSSDDHTNAYSYDNLNRLNSIVQTGSAVATKCVEFEYNANSQLTFIDRFNDTTSSTPIIRTSYDYAVR